GVEKGGDGGGGGQDRVGAALPRAHLPVLDLDVPVATTGARDVVLHAEVLRHGGAAFPLGLEARGQELLEELLGRHALGCSRLLGHVIILLGPRDSGVFGGRSFCHRGSPAGNRNRSDPLREADERARGGAQRQSSSTNAFSSWNGGALGRCMVTPWSTVRKPRARMS